MNWDQVEGKWKQVAGSFREKFGKITNDDLTVLNGKKDQLVGKLQERYGDSKEDAERRLEEWRLGLRSETRANTAAGAHRF